MKSKHETVSDALRKVIIGSDLSALELERRTGISNSIIGRFVRGERGLTLASVDVLADFFGLVLRKGRSKCAGK